MSKGLARILSTAAEVADVFLGSMANGLYPNVAIKIFRRIHMDGTVNEQFGKYLYEQAKVWHRLKHPNILPFLGIALDLGLSPALISPYCPSAGIMAYLQSVPMHAPERLDLVYGVAQGLAYLHSEGVIHGNLCTKKILINAQGTPVISGYGLVNISGEAGKKNPLVSPSWRFTAPEFCDLKESAQDYSPPEITKAGEVYAFSMVALEIISGLHPFHDLPNEISVILHILPGGRPSRSHLDPLVTTDRLWRFLQQLWNYQPALRPDMDWVLGALKFIQSGVDAGEVEPALNLSLENNHVVVEEVSFGHPFL
ncbi:kinase-like domain-containing protein, partial [Mycena rebaudengoi]